MIDRRHLLLSGAAFGLLACAGTERLRAEEFEITRTDAEWRAKLTPDQYRILRQAETERPFSSALNDEKREGIFHCAACDQQLYSSQAKFDSGTGWPSFTKALPQAVGLRKDSSAGMERTEVHCRRCGGHLGHVFDDGPKPTGKRHCINGLALAFVPGEMPAEP